MPESVVLILIVGSGCQKCEIIPAWCVEGVFGRTVVHWLTEEIIPCDKEQVPKERLCSLSETAGEVRGIQRVYINVRQDNAGDETSHCPFSKVKEQDCRDH